MMIVRSRYVALADGLRPAALHIRDGRIVRIEDDAPRGTGAEVIDAGESIVMPGLVDSHVHMNDPGRAHWEGFESATRAAAAGGVTTLVDMPLNCVPATTTVGALDHKRRAAAGRCHVDVAFWGGVVPGNQRDLEPLARAGVRGFKCFLSPSGVEEFEHVGEADLRSAMPILSDLNLPLLVHAELPGALIAPQGDPRQYRTWLDSRPPSAEVAAVTLLMQLALEYGTRIHIVHLATAAALPVIRQARGRGARVTVETCPHYLTFAAEDVGEGDTPFKCAPPIRESQEREELWNALLTGELDFVATDHSPAPAALKHVHDGDFLEAWGGIASLQLGLLAVWTGASQRGASPLRLVPWLSEGPARLAGLFPAKGRLAAGADADLVIWDPDADTQIDGNALYHRHPVTPYHGRRLRGRVRTTILRGDVVFEDGTCRGPAQGRLL
jgi:allantoinase